MFNFNGLIKEIVDYKKAMDRFSLLTNNFYKGNLCGQMIYEYLQPNMYYLYVANANGTKPLAVKTVDKIDSNELAPCVLSAVPLEQGYNIIGVKKDGEDYQMQVYKVTFTSHIKLEMDIVYEGSTYGLFPSELAPSVREAIDKLNLKPIPNWEQQINKHVNNPARTVETRLLINKYPEDSTRLVGVSGDKAVIELSNSTKDHILEQRGEIPTAVIARVFYYNKYKRVRHRFVTGIILDYLTREDLEDYLPTCRVDDDAVVEVTLINGVKMLGLVTGQNILLLYKHVEGYKSIKIKPDSTEYSYIKSVEHISI